MVGTAVVGATVVGLVVVAGPAFVAGELEPLGSDDQLVQTGTEIGNGDESPFSFEEHRPHIIDEDEGEASDHIDSNGEDNGPGGLDDEPPAQP